MSEDKFTAEEWATLQAQKMAEENVAALARLMDAQRKQDKDLRESERRIHWTLVFAAAFAQREDMRTYDKIIEAAEQLIDSLDRKGYFPD